MKMIRLLSSAPNYERDTPNMSRAKCLKRGEKCFNVFSEHFPFADNFLED